MKTPKLLSLRPCQFVLGMKEVDDKVRRMKKMNEKEMREFCEDHVIPVVRGPRDQHYIVDHHHFARAGWELGIKDYSVSLLEDMSDLSEDDFWSKMIKRDWAYLHDQFGLGPHDPSALPVDIRCLADDPYRSLVWLVIDEGKIDKDKVPFFEFKWAAFFRFHLKLRLHSKSDFTEATKIACTLASSRAADHLPGFTGKSKARKKK